MTELPYAGTQGWAGTDTSRDRAYRESVDGTASERQRSALDALGQAGARGLTVVDARALLDLHHGQASGVLSVLHMTGRICLLTDRRDRCHVYVLPEYVGDRETLAHKANRAPAPVAVEDQSGFIAALLATIRDLQAGQS